MNDSNVVFFSFVFAFILFLMLWAVRRSWQQTKALKDHGVKTMAEVLKRTYSSTSSTDDNGLSTTDDSYYIEVTFMVNSTPQKRHIAISREQYDAFPAGTQVEVIYLPEKPSVVRVASDIHR
jgi:hypothetical protein